VVATTLKSSFLNTYLKSTELNLLTH